MSTQQATNMERELSNLLSAYLLGWQNLTECADWLSTVDWENVDLTSKLASTLGELDLLCTEAREGLRPESDFERKASDIVAAISCVRYSVVRPEIMVSSSSASAVVESPVLPFWSRSPLREPV